MRFSRKGAKDNRARLVWSKYFNYKLENKDYYFKQKAYATHCDGWTEHETIKEQTYKNAIKRGNECKEIIVEEDILAASLSALALIFDQEYAIGETEIKGSILKAKEIVEGIKRHSEISKETQYRIFRRVLDIHARLAEEGIAI